MLEYEVRDALLLQHGISDYQAYLTSDFWRQKRKRVVFRDKHLCRLCGYDADNVHHESYDEETMFGKAIHRLVSLCRDCHIDIEYDDQDRKLTLAEVAIRVKGFGGWLKPGKKCHNSQSAPYTQNMPKSGGAAAFDEWYMSLFGKPTREPRRQREITRDTDRFLYSDLDAFDPLLSRESMEVP